MRTILFSPVVTGCGWVCSHCGSTPPTTLVMRVGGPNSTALLDRLLLGFLSAEGSMGESTCRLSIAVAEAASLPLLRDL